MVRTGSSTSRPSMRPAGSSTFSRATASLHVERRQAVGGELLGVDPQPHGVGLVAPDVDPADLGDGLQPLDEELVGDARQLEQVAAVAADGDLEDRRLVGVGLRDRRRVDVGGQVALGPRHPVADVVGGGLEVGVELELDGDRRASLAADRGQGADAGDAVDRLLERLGDLRLDDVGGGAAVVGRRR